MADRGLTPGLETPTGMTNAYRQTVNLGTTTTTVFNNLNSSNPIALLPVPGVLNRGVISGTLDKATGGTSSGGSAPKQYWG